MANLFKDKLKRGEVVVVVNPDHPSPSLTEFIGGLDFDGVFIDCEHGVASVERVQDMCRAARAAGVESIVRPETVRRYRRLWAARLGLVGHLGGTDF
jgi:4-hydroxy-2-oxoheptanedioate aldolase